MTSRDLSQRLLEGRDAVGLVVVVQLDMIRARNDGARRRSPVDVEREPRGSSSRSRPHVDAELRRDLDGHGGRGGFRPEALTVALAVDVGGVDQRDSGVDRGVDDGARALEVDPAAEVVAPEPDAGDGEGRATERCSGPSLDRTSAARAASRGPTASSA